MSYEGLPGFKKLLMQRYGINSIEEVQDPLAKMYLDFALSTVYRAELVKNIILKYTDIKGKRYLDVGCAYGGFLASFEKAGAVDVTGIDINEQLLDYSRAVIADCNSKARVYNKNIVNGEEVQPLGEFDLITCNDVIEHVDNAKAALNNMISMLNQKGILFMQIPNRMSASFIRSDGHFQLFGISILPKPLADKYFNAVYPASRHDVTYKSLNYYLNNLKELGMECNVIKPMQEDKDKSLKSILNTFNECEKLINEDLISIPPELKDTVKKRVLKMSALFKRQYNKYLNLKNTGSNSSEVLAGKLIQKFGEDFWIILAGKPVCK